MQVEIPFLDNLATHSFADAIEMRYVTMGTLFASVFMETMVGIELSPEILASQVYQRLVKLFSLASGICNDLIGLGKDIAQAQHRSNLVLIHHLMFHTTLYESCVAMCALHTRTVQECDVLAEELLGQVPFGEGEGIKKFVSMLRYFVTGGALWHVEAERYQQYATFESGKRFVVKVGCKAPKTSKL